MNYEVHVTDMHTVSKLGKNKNFEKKKWRHEQGSNLRGQCPKEPASFALTTRPSYHYNYPEASTNGYDN